MDIFEVFFITIGILTTSFCASALLIIGAVKFKSFLRNQKKNKWFCHHEYELKWVDGIAGESDRYIFVCRKCRKRHEIKAYNKVTESRTFYGSETMLLVNGKEVEYES